MFERTIIFGDVKPDYLLIQCVGEQDLPLLKTEYSKIRDEVKRSFMLVALLCNDWNAELSPWEAPAVFGNESFSGQAEATLNEIEKITLPFIESRYLAQDAKLVIGGYSLAALFALWCGYVTDTFDAVAAASPSVWFDGWLDFIASNKFKAKSVYLSLGDQEENTKNRRLSAVGKNINLQREAFMREGIDCRFKINTGGHFSHPELRCAREFINIMNK